LDKREEGKEALIFSRAQKEKSSHLGEERSKRRA